jgi:hypothetical protein
VYIVGSSSSTPTGANMSGSTLKKSSSPEGDLDVSSMTEESGAGMDIEEVGHTHQSFQNL